MLAEEAGCLSRASHLREQRACFPRKLIATNLFVRQINLSARQALIPSGYVLNCLCELSSTELCMLVGIFQGDGVTLKWTIA